MGHIPLSTIIIALAMLVFSVLIVSRIGGKIPLSGRAKGALLLFGAAAFLVGVYLHLNEALLPVPPPAHVAKEEKGARQAFEFTFSPLQARWGDEVKISVPLSAESVTVYLNGVPLPKRSDEGGRTIRITVPSGAKTGYLELERDKNRVRATEKISIKP
jgi:hypothetical protein